MDKGVTLTAESDFADAEAIRIAESDGLITGVCMGACHRFLICFKKHK